MSGPAAPFDQGFAGCIEDGHLRETVMGGTCGSRSLHLRDEQRADGPDRRARLRQRRRGARPARRAHRRTSSNVAPDSGSRSPGSPCATCRRPASVELADGVLTRDAHAVVADPDIDLVVEAIGGIEPARELILDALANGKPVVTANKELLANVGAELLRGRRRGRRRPAVRSGGRRRHPDHPGPAREPARRADQPGARASSTARPTSSSPR